MSVETFCALPLIASRFFACLHNFAGEEGGIEGHVEGNLIKNLTLIEGNIVFFIDLQVLRHLSVKPFKKTWKYPIKKCVLNNGILNFHLHWEFAVENYKYCRTGLSSYFRYLFANQITLSYRNREGLLSKIKEL